jgi:hypothetical protein
LAISALPNGLLPKRGPQAWRRFVSYLPQACAAEAAQPLPAPPAPRQLYKAVLRATDHQRERPKNRPAQD